MDPITGQQFPSTSYLIEVATFPSVALQGGQPNAATAAAVKQVEPQWNIQTKFAIAYQQVFTPNAVGGGYLVLEATMQAIWAICHTRNQPGVVNGSEQIPKQLQTREDWDELALEHLANPVVRNFFYFGHGGPNAIGQKFPSNIRVTDLNLILMNSTTGSAYGAPNNHPYRFVFFYGCNTAGGKLPEAFGIPNKRNMSAKSFNDQGMRFRAFMGSKTEPSVGQPMFQVAFLERFRFLSGFFDKWAEPRANPRRLIEAKQDAQAVAGPGNSPWNGANDLIIYGYQDLLWQDTFP